MNQLVDIAKAHGGFITASDATSAGIPRRRLTEAVNIGTLSKIERGLYALPDSWEDEYLIAQHRFARGIFSHGTALFLHHMTDTTPANLTMTFPHGYNTTSARHAGLVAKTISPHYMDLGRIDTTTPYGNPITTYDIERTLCDIVRGQATPDIELVNPAMRAYAASRGKDVNKLLGYARLLGVEGKIRNYLEVLL